MESDNFCFHLEREKEFQKSPENPGDKRRDTSEDDDKNKQSDSDANEFFHLERSPVLKQTESAVVTIQHWKNDSLAVSNTGDTTYFISAHSAAAGIAEKAPMTSAATASPIVTPRSLSKMGVGSGMGF